MLLGSCNLGTKAVADGSMLASTEAIHAGYTTGIVYAMMYGVNARSLALP